MKLKPHILKRFLVVFTTVFLALFLVVIIKNFLVNNNLSVDKNELEMLQWNRPTTDAEWAEDVLAEGLNFRFDYQLEEMLPSHTLKRDIMAEELKKYVDCPECLKYDIGESLKADFKGAELEQKIDEMFNEQFIQKRQDYQMIARSVERIGKEIDLRKKGVVNRKSDILKITPSTDREKEELKKLFQTK